jgi:hypothetical protein
MVVAADPSTWPSEASLRWERLFKALAARESLHFLRAVLEVREW